MDFLIKLFTEDSVAQAVVVLSLVAATGLMLGNLKIFGIGLGIGGVLFSGLAFAHFGFHVNEHILEFVREFGLILFVYTIGVQVGPGFLNSLKRQGLPLNLLAAMTVFGGVFIAIIIHFVAGIDILATVGLLCGGVTNTPSLGAVQQAIKDIPSVSPEQANLPSLGYAIAYPFGILGTIMSMLIMRAITRVDPVKESEKLMKEHKEALGTVVTTNLQVTNPNLDGLRIHDIPGLFESKIVISRVLHGEDVKVATPDTIVHLGDTLLAVGPKDKLQSFKLIVGVESEVDLIEHPSDLTFRRIIVTHKEVLGKSLEELDLWNRYGVVVTRVSRADVEFTAVPDVRLEFADTVRVVGEDEAINKVAMELGNSVKRLNHPAIIPVFVGIALGVILGSIPVQFLGIPAPVKLGLAGGPLVVAIILSRIGRIGSLIWYMPISANFMLRELGIVLFLSCVGLKAGGKFVETLTQGDGLMWMGWATLITLLPLLLATMIGTLILKVNYVTLCGVLAGSMTDPPALSFAQQMTGSDGPSISYATVYPLTMILRVITAQLVVLLLVR